MWTHPRLEVIHSTSRSGMASRAYDMAYALGQIQALQHLYELSKVVNSEIEGIKLDMKFTSVPTYLSNQPGADGYFNKTWMSELRALGQSRALGETPWDNLTSAFERP